MPTLVELAFHLLPNRRLPALHRWCLRLRTRWLGWRGVAPLQLAGSASPLLTARELEFRRLARGLLELNLMLERARGVHATRSTPGGVAR
ncbi:MAG: hypothetical protein KGI67_14515 [Pseudomonadota bacterium]|nr:hypothetical protein [Pseudomonadota bacterium]